MFQQVDGTFITASQLRSDGGEHLLGPDNSYVRVLRTRRHEAERRCFFRIHTSESMLEVTDDHRVIAQGPNGSQVSLAALEVRPQILTGAGLQPVQRFEVDHRSSVVIEPIFENDAPVLVWTRPGRRFTRAELGQAFAVQGGMPDVYSFFDVKRGFFDDVREPPSSSAVRSRSADSHLTLADQRRLARARSGTLSRPRAVAVQDTAD
mmetsp:Transcript_103446/g.179547  ORF Transcript_103446/g.179547 Transcript_103446/m.179547 type:complete len:207 (+) Transcript_103446:1170-1790(+)